MPDRDPSSCISRRTLLAGLAAAIAGRAASAATPVDAPTAGERQAPAFQTIEARVGGRLGVTATDVGTGLTLRHRPAERFPMCSTFKWVLAAAVLARVEAGEDRLDRAVAYGPSDLLNYAPVTTAHVSEGRLSVEALCAAAVQVSDNTAANLLLPLVGGPEGLTRWIRSLGDPVTRLDRVEPDLNEVEPGDARDTTTPDAMVGLLQTVLLGDVLTPAGRERLTGWLITSTTGTTKLRAGLPEPWRVGDKTGMGARGATNDVAIAWPPTGGPILIAAYLRDSDAPVDARNGALAEVGREVARRLGQRPYVR